MCIMRDLLTASRWACLQTCPYRHYLRYEVGLRTATPSDALRFGSAWHRAMEARAKGADITGALAAGIGDRTEVDELQVATLSGMLAGYWHRWGTSDGWVMTPEVEFAHAMRRGRGCMWAAGKIDGIITLPTCQLIEYKTAGSDIGPDSDYWLRLRGNPQVLQYVEGARRVGHDPLNALYDVARKPEIAPRKVPILDVNGLKVVTVDATGARAVNKNGEPRQSAGEGLTLATRPETPEEFGDRLAADTMDRPDFYFARREVPILEDDLARFRAERDAVAAEIQWRRRMGAWPRHVDERSCGWCEFAGPCLQGTPMGAEAVPAGFVVGERHEELTQHAG